MTRTRCRLATALAACALAACAQASTGSDSETTTPDDLCAAAAAHAEECLGITGAAQDCDPQAAQAILDQSCEELSGGDGDSADSALGGLLCSFGFTCKCAPVPGAAAIQIIEDDGCAGPCKSGTGGHGGGSYHFAPPNHGASCSWDIPVGAAGRHRIRAFAPVQDGNSVADYAIETCSGRIDKPAVSQELATAGWIDLGEVTLEPGARVTARGSTSGDSFLCDAIEVTRL